jgi:alpha-L-arabinofuranosidase
VLRADLDGPQYGTARYGHVPALDAVATHDPDTGDLTLFAVNRDQHGAAELTVNLRGFDLPLEPAEAWTLADHDRHAANTAGEPDRVTLRPIDGLVADRDKLTVALPAISWSAIRLRPVPAR